jgi:hypothetical protein
MKIFEVIHLLLIAGLLFGVPVAATTRPPGQAFSWNVSLKQAGVVTLVFVALLALNFVLARVASRRTSQRK